MQGDKSGMEGDVRDILVETNEGPVGVSAKHRHDALKHPRLSGTIDFGKQWYGVPCSTAYWQAVRPLFKELEGRGHERWANLPDKQDRYYTPVLDAFIAEVNSLARPDRLVQYLLGHHDFYKVIKSNGSVVLQSFNMGGSLRWGHTVPVGREIVRFARKRNSKTTAILHTDKGWQISFRLHNANAMIEPSLKFDVRLVGAPQVLARHEIPLG